MTRLALFALAPLVLAANVPAEQLVPFGRVAHLDGIQVKPLKIIEDSRCPMNARCIWAGRLRISALVTHGKTRVTRELELGKSVPVADGQLMMDSSNPSRMTNKKLRSRDYRFGFRFEGGR